MKRITTALLATAALVFGWTVYAQPGAGTWTDPSGSTCSSLQPQQACLYEFTADVNSARLEVKSRDFNVHLYATNGCEVYIMRCSSNACTSGEEHKILPDTDGDGVRDDVTLDGTNMRIGMQNVQASWVFVDVDIAPSSDTCRVTVEGH